ncbi:MAG: MATE family efflux transporter [Phycisphaerales bacterium]|nr:MATE family efflux transporter [Phycisphaerales bacterium]
MPDIPLENIIVAPTQEPDAGFWPESRKLLRLASPTIAAMTSLTAAQFLDGWMLSRLDQHGVGVNLAASFNGGLLAYALISFLLGFATCVSSLASQSLGRNEPRQAAIYAWQGMWLSALTALICWPLIPFAGDLFWLVGHHGVLLQKETLYFRFALASVPLTFGMSVLGSFFIAVRRPIYQFIASGLGNGVNLLLDWVLIFGHWGFPRLGLLGAAIAFFTGAAVSLAAVAVVFLSKNYRRDYGTLEAWKLQPSHAWRLLRIGVFAGVQIASDTLSWGIFSIAVVDRFGAVAAEATSVVFRYTMVSFMPVVGLGAAVTVMVGQKIGAGDKLGARRVARRSLIFAMAYMGLCGVLFVVMGGPLARLILTRPAEVHLVQRLLLIAAAFQIFDAMNITFMGALRGAGDTLVPGIVTGVLSWGVCVLGGWLVGRLAPGWGSQGSWMMAAIYASLLGIFAALRWRAATWEKFNILGTRLKPEP